MKTCGEWRYSSTILDLGTRCRWVVNFTPRPLYPRGKRPRCPLYMRLGGLQNLSGRCGVEKNLLPSPESNPGRPARGCADWAIPAPGLCQFRIWNSVLLKYESNYVTYCDHTRTLWCSRWQECVLCLVWIPILPQDLTFCRRMLKLWPSLM
jgi:hypothetical protein